jgi:hypothetical protein
MIKLHPMNTYGQRRCTFMHSLSSALDDGEWSASQSTFYSKREIRQHPPNWKLRLDAVGKQEAPLVILWFMTP